MELRVGGFHSADNRLPGPPALAHSWGNFPRSCLLVGLRDNSCQGEDMAKQPRKYLNHRIPFIVSFVAVVLVSGCGGSSSETGMPLAPLPHAEDEEDSDAVSPERSLEVEQVEPGERDTTADEEQ